MNLNQRKAFMINIPASPYTRPEMFLPDVMVDDEK